MSFNVSSAEKENFLLHSTCSDVRSKSRGGASFPFFDDEEMMVSGAVFIFSITSSASASALYRPLVLLNVVSR